MTKITILNNENLKVRLDVFLTNFFENKYPRNKITSVIENNLILVNQKPQKASYKLKLNDEIELNENETHSSFGCNEMVLVFDKGSEHFEIYMEVPTFECTLTYMKEE